MLRHTLLFLSRRPALRRWMESSRFARNLTRRFVAGEDLDSVMAVLRAIEKRGLLATVDYLGENVASKREARASRDAATEALEAIHREGLHATISIKLTQFGLDLSDELCAGNVETVVKRAKELDGVVEIDMEGSAYTSRTLEIVEAMHARHACVRAVVQAYLYRTGADVRGLNKARVPVRLCKGAYDEPVEVAFPSKHEVDSSYLTLAKALLDEGAYPALATHDERIITELLRHIAAKQIAPERFEFQMLYGVRRDLQDWLAEQGFRVRLYVPYGAAWYPYLMRRLAERPANVLFLVKNLLRR